MIHPTDQDIGREVIYRPAYGLCDPFVLLWVDAQFAYLFDPNNRDPWPVKRGSLEWRNKTDREAKIALDPQHIRQQKRAARQAAFRQSLTPVPRKGA